LHTVKSLATKRILIRRDITMFFGSFIFALFITMGAFVYIPLPFTPVPITLQVLFVLLAGVILGERFGTLSMLLYTGAGAIGFPVFAGAVGGISVVLGPTGGYIVGFLVAPLIISAIIKKIGKGIVATSLAMLAGLFVIYLFGVVHLSVFLANGFGTAVKLGVIPFVAGDLVKIALGVILVHSVWRKAWNS